MMIVDKNVCGWQDFVIFIENLYKGSFEKVGVGDEKFIYTLIWPR
jgi:hypothetical protein